MTDLRLRLEDALQPHTGSDGPGVGVPVDAALLVFAEWLRERAEGARFIAENAPDDEDLSAVATWGGARAALSALADEIMPKGGDGAA